MPYGPKSTPSGTDGLPAHARSVFRAAANSAYRKYGEEDEGRVHRIAWAAVKNAGYRKNKEGRWVTGDGMMIGDAIRSALRDAWNPDQPREPAGSPDGGQWTSGGGGGEGGGGGGEPEAKGAFVKTEKFGNRLVKYGEKIPGSGGKILAKPTFSSPGGKGGGQVTIHTAEGTRVKTLGGSRLSKIASAARELKEASGSKVKFESVKPLTFATPKGRNLAVAAEAVANLRAVQSPKPKINKRRAAEFRAQREAAMKQFGLKPGDLSKGVAVGIKKPSDVEFEKKWGIENVKPNLGRIRSKYRSNEEENLHSENIALLAKHFGTPEEHKLARAVIKEQNKVGHLPSKAPGVPDVREFQSEINSKYGHKIREKIENVKPGYSGAGAKGSLNTALPPKERDRLRQEEIAARAVKAEASQSHGEHIPLAPAKMVTRGYSRPPKIESTENVKPLTGNMAPNNEAYREKIYQGRLAARAKADEPSDAYKTFVANAAGKNPGQRSALEQLAVTFEQEKSSNPQRVAERKEVAAIVERMLKMGKDSLSVRDARRVDRIKDRRSRKVTQRDPRGREESVFEEEEFEDSNIAREPLVCDAIAAQSGSGEGRTMMFDSVELDDSAKVRITSDGYLVATPRVARVGIQVYRGSECNKADMETVRIYRPPEEVFDSTAMHSFTHRPMTLDHPDKPVTADNWKKVAVGQTGEEVLRDGNAIRVPMVLMDADAIQAYKDGKNQLSVGYDCDIDWTPGVTDGGEKYDAVQRNIRANHLAVVAAARGGPTLKIGDDGSNTTGDQAMNMKTILVDGIECPMTDTAAVIVQRTFQRMQDQVENFKKKAKQAEENEEAWEEDSAGKLAEIEKRDEAIKAKDAEIVTLKAQLKDAQAELDPAKLDARVIDRLSVISKAKAFLGDKWTASGKNTQEIRREVVAAKVGDAAKAWDDKQVEAAFVSLQVPTFSQNKDSQQRSPIDDAVAVFGRPGGGYATMEDARMAAYDSYDKDLNNAWQGKTN